MQSPNPSPFPDFDFSFNPASLDPSLFPPPPPPLPSSADLFTSTETSEFFGFLDNLNWELDVEHQFLAPDDTLLNPSANRQPAPYSNPHLNTAPDPSATRRGSSRSLSSRGAIDDALSPPLPPIHSPPALAPPTQHSQASTSTIAPPPAPAPLQPEDSAGRSANKAALSTPQKRLNHIMSEQKRRNAIRDGYAQLITLLSPADAAHQPLAMPTRGRPKGSGARNKGRGQGKSGVLFRAVEYVKWLEEGTDALRREVDRVEQAAGIRHP